MSRPSSRRAHGHAAVLPCGTAPGGLSADGARALRQALQRLWLRRLGRHRPERVRRWAAARGRPARAARRCGGALTRARRGRARSGSAGLWTRGTGATVPGGITTSTTTTPSGRRCSTTREHRARDSRGGGRALLRPKLDYVICSILFSTPAPVGKKRRHGAREAPAAPGRRARAAHAQGVQPSYMAHSLSGLVASRIVCST